jgi:dienelactone hydrolase
MKRALFLACVLWAAAAVEAGAENSTRVWFASIETYAGAGAFAPSEIDGILTLPVAAKEPVPAIIMLHGCSGLENNHTRWARLFADWGYASLRVDSFSPRQIDEICTDIMRPVPRSADVNGAIAFLQGLEEIDSTRLLLMGWSHGASVTLRAIAEPGTTHPDLKPGIVGAIAVYPYCARTSEPFGVPLLVLIGEEDDWTPAGLCEAMTREHADDGSDVQLVVYPDATHSYDCHGCNGEYFGHTLIFNEEAYDDSVVRVHEFLKLRFGS